MEFYKDSHIVDTYKGFTAITGPPGRHLIKQAKLLEPSNGGSLIILDNACGTGLITSLLYEMLGDSEKEKLQIICGDFSEGMVNVVQETINTCGWKGAKAQLVDAQV
jgi:ubiquinone/menaquinone biosynthesis C-methylase UbiE